MDSITNSMDMSVSKFQETMKERETWYAAVHGISISQKRQPLNENNNACPMPEKLFSADH